MSRSTEPWSLYILECEDGTFYTGISPDPESRFEKHQQGKGAAYTRAHRPLKILVTELVGTYSEALKRERQIKKLSKDSKRRFIGDPARFPRRSS